VAWKRSLVERAAPRASPVYRSGAPTLTFASFIAGAAVNQGVEARQREASDRSRVK
jgi:hypothetical protein